MKDTIKYLVWIFAIVPFLIACGDSNTDDAPTDDFDVRFELPATVDVAKGGELTFTVKEGKSPLTTDSFLLEGGGISYLCPILRTSSESFTVRLADECESGSYTAYLKRDARKKSIGKIYINIVDKIDFEPSAGTTVFGLVSSEEGPVANVVVSDGTEVTVTDDKGIYELKSAKKWGYVFISVPSGYEVAAEGVFPQFYQTLKGAPDVVEQKDFKLTKVDGQDRYKLFLLGDMHLANRTNDAAQFTQFTTDLNAYMAQHSGQKMYALTLGDMTWDLYWYKNNYALPQYRETINRQVKNLQIYHTMGNHDNDFMTTSDYDAAVKYVDCIGPTFYSFNIGQVHYVVMDNIYIYCSAYDGTDSRNYVKKLSNEQLKWLAKDLAYVDKSTPLIVAMHAQIYKPTSTGFAFDHDSANTEALLAALDGYEVHFVTGHTHKVYNITPDDDVVKGRDIHEHNSGAICASWWWSGNLTPGVHVSIDGAPGGYAIWDIDGTDFAWLYKSTGWPEEYQFRSYDLNNVSFSMDDVPNIPSNVLIQLAYKKYVNAYPENSDNEVLIKIWNWNSNWELSVVDERGKTLEYTPVWAYDPLHIAALSVPRFNNSGITSTPSFVTESATNFFKVKADDADVDLTITVKDEFGHTWTEEMQRPKAFSTDAYKLR